MRILRTVPAVLAGLLLAAHYLRRQDIPFMLASLAIVVLALVPRRAARVTARIALGVGVLIWLRTAVVFAHARMAQGVPYTRMLLIIGGVAAFTAIAALVLPGPRPRPAAAGGTAVGGASAGDPDRP